MFLVRVVLLLALIGSISFSASASTVHEVRFQQSAKVLVWQDGALIGQGPSVNLAQTRPVQPATYFGNGVLEPTAASTLDGYNSVLIRVASNTAFSIKASAYTADTRVTSRLINTGSNARSAAQTVSQLPLTGPAQTVFSQAEKTAVRPGAPQTQTL